MVRLLLLIFTFLYFNSFSQNSSEPSYWVKNSREIFFKNESATIFEKANSKKILLIKKEEKEEIESSSKEKLEIRNVKFLKKNSLTESKFFVHLNTILEKNEKLAGGLSDFSRIASLYAGVSNTGGYTNEIIIRGNSPKGLSWRLDGMEVFSPSHFSLIGYSAGGISALSTNIVSSSDFYMGAFPAEFGNATSGVIDVQLRKGNSEERKSSLQIGTQGIEVSTEGPLSKQSGASYLVNARYNDLKIISTLGYDSKSLPAVPKYSDVFFKIFIPSKKYTFSAWGLAGNSDFNYNPSSGYTPIGISDMLMIGSNIVYSITEKSTLETRLSATKNEFSTGAIYQNYTSTQTEKNQSLRFSTTFISSLSEGVTFRAGLIASKLGYAFDTKEQNIQEKTIKKDQLESHYFQGFLQYRYQLKSVSLNVGLHGSFFSFGAKSTIEPRASLRIKLNPKNSVSIAFGNHSKLESFSVYNAISGTANNRITNENLEIPVSNQVVLGYQFTSKKWRLALESYYQHHSSIGISPFLNLSKTNPLNGYSLANEINSTLENTLLESIGEAKNYGIEISLQKAMKEGWFVMATSSLQNASYLTAEGVWKNSRFNANFIQNILIGKEWKVGRQNRLNISLRALAMGGRREVPILLEESISKGYMVKDYATGYENQLPMYRRGDIKISYVKMGGKTKSSFSLDIQNFTNEQNNQQIVYVPSEKRITPFYQVGMIPRISYQIDF